MHFYIQDNLIIHKCQSLRAFYIAEPHMPLGREGSNLCIHPRPRVVLLSEPDFQQNFHAEHARECLVQLTQHDKREVSIALHVFDFYVLFGATYYHIFI